MIRKPIYLLATADLPEGLVREAARAEMTLDIVPFIGIEYIDKPEGISTLLAQPLAVVFTSVNSVNAVRRWIKGAVPDWKVYCTSGATCGAVVEVFGEKAVAGKAASASELAEVIREREAGLMRDREAGQGGEIVFFCGDHRREELPSLGLTEKIVYRTLLTPQRIGRNYDGIAFFSPSAVDSFFSVNSIAARVPLFAIGRTTGAAIHSACANPVFTCRVPDKAVLIRDMIDFFAFKP